MSNLLIFTLATPTGLIWGGLLAVLIISSIVIDLVTNKSSNNNSFTTPATPTNKINNQLEETTLNRH